MNKKGIRDYDKKARIVFQRQDGLCGITGDPIVEGNGKIDMHHILPKTKPNRKLYEHFIDSAWNLMLCYHNAHIGGGVLPKKIPYWQALIAEGILCKHPGLDYLISLKKALREFG